MLKTSPKIIKNKTNVCRGDAHSQPIKVYDKGSFTKTGKRNPSLTCNVLYYTSTTTILNCTIFIDLPVGVD